MRYLGLDIGRRRTGVAFADDAIGVPLAADVITCESEEDLVSQILQQCDERTIDVVVVGLPLLPSGKEGAQSSFVRLIGDRLESATIHVDYLDERYTTTQEAGVNGDVKAAVQLLTTYLERR